MAKKEISDSKKAKWSAKKQAAVLSVFLIVLLFISMAVFGYFTPGAKNPTTTILQSAHTSNGSTGAGPNQNAGLGTTGGGASGPVGSNNPPPGANNATGTNNTPVVTGGNINITTGGDGTVGISGGQSGNDTGSSPGSAGNGTATIGSSANCTVAGGGTGRYYLSDCEMNSIFGHGGMYSLEVIAPDVISEYSIDSAEMCIRAFNDTNWHYSSQPGVGSDAWGLDYIKLWTVTYDKCHGIGSNCTCGQVVLQSTALYSGVSGAKAAYLSAIDRMVNGTVGSTTTVVNATTDGALYSYYFDQRSGYGHVYLYMWKNDAFSLLDANINSSASVPGIASTMAAELP